MKDGCAVVAGASSGIGAATALALASLDVRVVAAARHPARLMEHAPSPDVRSRLDLVAADLTIPEEVESVFSHAESAHGRVRFVIHSVGSEYEIGWYRDAAPEHILGTISALVASPALVVSRALESMRSTGGTVGLVSSGAANRPTPGRALYSASKIAVNRLMESVAAECEADGTTTGVFAILPGRVDTPMQERLMRTARDAHPAFGLERFRSKEEVLSPEVVGSAIASLALRSPSELNGRVLRYESDGWRQTNP